MQHVGHKVRDVNELLAMTIHDLLREDDDDVDEFGMDMMTRKRLKVKTKMERKGKKKLRRPIRSKLPLSLSRV